MKNSETIHYLDLIFKTLENWYMKFAEMTPRLIVGIIVFALFFLFSTYLSKISVKIFHKFFPKSEQQNSVTTLIGVFKFLIVLLGTFISLEIMGLSGFLWKFIGSLGVAGVIAGVALKDLVSSMFSGILVGVDKSFKVGDYITIGGHSGTVQDIGFLTTKLLTDDGKKVHIPNQIIFNAPFYNVTDSPQRRIIFEFDIPADQDVIKARETILNVIRNLDEGDRKDEAEVLLTKLNQGNFTIKTKFWILQNADVNKVKSNALIEIKSQLDSVGIKLDSPQSITIENAVKSD